MLPRHELPQIPTKEIANFVQFCQKSGIVVDAAKIGVMKLHPVQKHLNVDKVKKLLQQNINVPLMISDDNYILDGHHRWAASAVRNKSAKIPCIRFQCSIQELFDLGHSFEGSMIKSIGENRKTGY